MKELPVIQPGRREGAPPIFEKIAQGAFHIHPSCVGLLSEMSSYEYKKEFDGDDVTFIQKVRPGQPDHASDCLRYGMLPLSAITAAHSYGKSLDFAIG